MEDTLCQVLLCTCSFMTLNHGNCKHLDGRRAALQVNNARNNGENVVKKI